MAKNSPIATPLPPYLADTQGDPVEVEVVAEGEEPGEEVVDLSGKNDVPDNVKQGAPFDANLAEFLSDDELNVIGGDLYEDVEADRRSRSDWEETYRKGLHLLGLKIEERSDPWQGACGIVHPILAESCVRFQAEIITESFPAAGPVKTKVLGEETPEKEKAAARVRDDLNYEIVEIMSEYRSEHERAMFNLPIAGSALKKIYFDATLGRQTSMFVAAEDFIVAYGASDLRTAPRYAYRMKKTPNEIKKLVAAKFYREVDLGEPVDDIDDIKQEQDEIAGQTTPVKAEYHTLYEINAYLNLPGFGESDDVALPYVVTIDKQSQKVLSIYRNWDENDPLKLREEHYVHYQYIPGFGFYGLGLIHLVGGFAEGATAILRQLVDAGTLANLPGGLKTRGLRIKGDDTPIGPGEWRDVDVLSGNIKENLMPLPYKEPSVVLANLLEKIVEEGRKFAAVAEMKVSDFDSNSPVGTTMALLERTLKVMSSVQARVYAAMKLEFRQIKTIIKRRMQADESLRTYRYTPQGGDQGTKQADYELIDVLPVADPNSATMSQRIVQYQAAMQLAETAPQVYDLPELHAQMLTTLGIPNVEKLIPGRKRELLPTDPVTENMSILTGKPVKAFLTQDHDSHIAVHMAAMQDPMIQQMVGQNPQAQALMAAGQAHLMEHIAFKYRKQMEEMMGTQLPAPEQPLPPEIEVQLSTLLAQAAPKLLGVSQEEAAAKRAEAAAKDPVLQEQLISSQVEMGELEHKKEIDRARLQLDWAKLQLEMQAKGIQLGTQVQTAKEKTQLEREKMEHDVMQTEREHQQTMQQLEVQSEIAQKAAEQQHGRAMEATDKQHEHEAYGKVFDFAREGVNKVADQRAQAKEGAAQRDHDRNKQTSELTYKQSEGKSQREHDMQKTERSQSHDMEKTKFTTAAQEKQAKAAAKAKPAADKSTPKKGTKK